MHAKKVLVIGIDGVSYLLLSSFFEKGLMPNLYGMARKGAFTGAHVHDDAVFISSDRNMQDNLPESVDIIDIAPTILDLLSVSSLQFDGRSLAGIR